MSSWKEPAFFSYRWERGLEDYAGFFDGWAGEHAIGEATPSYLMHPDAPRRIKEVLPEVKFIFCFRHPVRRARSHYWHRVAMGHETRSLDEVLAEGKKAFPVDGSCYATHLERYLELFDISRMYFFIVEFADDFPAALQPVLRFLGVDDSWDVPYRGPVNPLAAPRNRLFSRMAASGWAGHTARMLPGGVRAVGRRVLTRIRNAGRKPFTPPELSNDQFARIREYINPEIDELERILGVNLFIWHRD